MIGRCLYLCSMSVHTSTSPVILSILEKISYRAFQVIVQIADIFPYTKRSVSRLAITTQSRIRLILRLLQLTFEEAYDEDVILWCHNAIMADSTVRSECLKVMLSIGPLIVVHCHLGEARTRLDLATILERYKTAYPDDREARQLNVLRLLPFRTICDCGQQLQIEFTTTAYAINQESIQPCSLYESTCRKCSRTYCVSSVYLSAEKRSIVTPESLNASFFHLSCDKFAFSRQVLISFSSLLVNGHITFHGFVSGLLSTIVRLNPSDAIASSQPDLHVRLSRALQSYWIYYELAHLIFMTSNEVEFSFPSATSCGMMKVRFNVETVSLIYF